MHFSLDLYKELNYDIFKQSRIEPIMHYIISIDNNIIIKLQLKNVCICSLLHKLLMIDDHDVLLVMYADQDSNNIIIIFVTAS